MKFLLLPFSWIYGALTWLRNKLYDKGIFNAYRSPLFSIVVGNLQAGGAGKTPMTAFLYNHLKSRYKTAVLSRGYGRKTSGLLEASAGSTYQDIGDEPLWYHQTLPEARVVVSESRQKGLQYLENTDTELVLLDDAYQHRAIKGDVYLLLSEYSKPYYKDFPLPFGRLREYRSGDKRADLILITKCPAGLSLEEKINIIHQINPLDHQEVYFTALKASEPRPLKGMKAFKDLSFDAIVLVSGIANPGPFAEICKQWHKPLKMHTFKDHHHYTVSDIRNIEKDIANAVVICTEKDEVKLRASGLYSHLSEDAYFSLPVEVFFLFGEEQKFMKQIETVLKRNKETIKHI